MPRDDTVEHTPTSSWIVRRDVAHDDIDQTLRRFEEQLGLHPPSDQRHPVAPAACQRPALAAALQSKHDALNALTAELRTQRAVQVCENRRRHSVETSITTGANATPAPAANRSLARSRCSTHCPVGCCTRPPRGPCPGMLRAQSPPRGTGRCPPRCPACKSQAAGYGALRDVINNCVCVCVPFSLSQSSSERLDQVTADHEASKGCMRALQHHCATLEQRTARGSRPPETSKTKKTADKPDKPRTASVSNALTVLRRQLEAQGLRTRHYKRLAWQLQQQLCAAQAALLQLKAAFPDAPPPGPPAKAHDASLAACQRELLEVTGALHAAESRCAAAEAARDQAAAHLQQAREAVARQEAALHALQVRGCVCQTKKKHARPKPGRRRRRRSNGHCFECLSARPARTSSMHATAGCGRCCRVLHGLWWSSWVRCGGG